MGRIEKEVVEKTVAELTESSFWKKLLSGASTVSSMRFVFIVGVSFTLINWAIMTYIVIFKLYNTDGGLAVLAVVIGSISAGVIGIVGSLTGFKAAQAKSENNK